MHGREHRAFNNRLAELGYPTKVVERFTKKGLAFREKVAPPISNLARRPLRSSTSPRRSPS